MKYFILTSLAVLSFSFSYAGTCVDVTSALARGAESSSVKVLQQFLVEKGHLKAVPNGYFGAGTQTALRAYQKSKGISQTGTTGPATRAALKKDSCGTTSQNTVVSPVVSTPVQNQVATTSIPVVTLPAPKLTSLDLTTLFAGGTTDWSLMVYGTGFSTSSNTMKLFSRSNGKVYTLGNSASSDGKQLALPINLTGKTFPCGTSCLEKIQPGDYDLVISHGGGESNTLLLSVKPFNLSVVTGTISAPLSYTAKNARIGTVSFASSAIFKITDITPTISTSEGFVGGGISGLVLKDELSGQTLAYDKSVAEVLPNQSKIIGLYGTVSTQVPGRVTTTFALSIEDYIGHKKTTFISGEILTSIAQ